MATARRPADPDAPSRPVPGDLSRLAWLLDARFRIPGLGVRFGLDPLVGLVPVVGDLAVGAAGLWIVGRALALGAPRAVVAKMVLNLVGDLALGAVPLVGDVADVGFKAHLRNVKLLEAWLARPAGVQRRSRLVLWGWGVGLGAVVLAGAAAVGLVALSVLRALFGAG